MARLYPTPMPSLDRQPVEATIVPNLPVVPTLLWDTPRHAFHAVRVTCDNLGLSLEEKDLICACIYQESMFKNTAKCENKVNGAVVSTDWGLCQINDHYHIGVKKDFPSVQFVVDNPQKVVEWMISMYKHGLLKQWVSYSSGAYKKWLSPISPMWLLKVV